MLVPRTGKHMYAGMRHKPASRQRGERFRTELDGHDVKEFDEISIPLEIYRQASRLVEDGLFDSVDHAVQCLVGLFLCQHGTEQSRVSSSLIIL